MQCLILEIVAILQFSQIEGIDYYGDYDSDDLGISILDFRERETNKTSDYEVLDNNTSRLKLKVNVNTTDALTLNVSSLDQYPALRIYTNCSQCTAKNPLIITVRRLTEIVSWKLPIFFPNKSSNIPIQYNHTSRTLCPLVSEENEKYDDNKEVEEESEESKEEEDGEEEDDGDDEEKEDAKEDDDTGIGEMEDDYQNQKLLNEKVRIYLSTNNENITCSVYLIIEFEDFELEMDNTLNKEISPTEPRYFRFNLPSSTNEDEKSDQRYFLDASSNDNTCMLLSIQDSKCPVNDLISNVKFSGDYQTVNRSGGMFISEREFGKTVHIVMVALPDDSECHLNPYRTWEKVEANIDDGNRDMRKLRRLKTVTFMIKESTSANENEMVIIGTILGFIAFSLVVILIIVTQCGFEFYKNDASRRDVFKGRIAPDDHHIQYSFLYFKELLIISLFYGIPVVQLVLSYERSTNERGNKDQCYFNFKCAHAFLWGDDVKISDFNHFFSNIGYVILGLLGLFCVRIHQLKARLALRVASNQEEQKQTKEKDSRQNADFSWTVDDQFVLKDYGLYYALALSIILQGIMSACYHICPNNVNFQFDTIFMFAISVLTMTTMYNRLNPWQAISVFTVYGILAVLLFVSVVGVYMDAERYTKDHSHHQIFRALVSQIKGTFALFFCYLCYTEQRIELTIRQFTIFLKAIWNLCKRMRRLEAHHVKAFLTPRKPKRLLVIVIWYILNVCLSFMVVLADMDYIMGVLSTLTVNTLFFLLLYFLLKIIFKEHITYITHACVFLTNAFWIPALYYFLAKKVKNDEVSPAMSRELNKECSLANFYDDHDIWHFLGSVGLFLNLMILLTLDDGLRSKPNKNGKGDFRIRGNDESQRARPLTMRFEA